MGPPRPKPDRLAPEARTPPETAGRPFNPLAALWRLFFAVDHRPPRNFFERRRRRFRASFFFFLGIAATLAVQALLEGRR